MKGNIDTNKINRFQYFNELKNSKVVVSPFGLGEITLKDFEVFLTGGLLIKPNMNHMETWPPLFEDKKTFITYKWDLSDFEFKLQSILENSEIRTSIAEEGQRNYAKYTSSKDASKLFIDHLKSILNSV